MMTSFGLPVSGAGDGAPHAAMADSTATAAIREDMRMRLSIDEAVRVTGYTGAVRFLGVDYGVKRIGLALSDHAATLARPWQVVPAAGAPAASAVRIGGVVAALRASDDPDLDGIVVGLPRRLNGEDTDQTPAARAFAASLQEATGLPVTLVDERLTSVEAESRLAAREPDWRKRKAVIDAEAAAILLQDFLDGGCR